MRFSPTTVPNTITVFVLIPSTAQVGDKVYLKDVPEIRDRPICGLSVVDVTSLAEDPNARAIFGNPEDLILNLCDKQSFYFHDSAPMNDYCDLRNLRPTVRWKPKPMNIERSFMQILDTSNNGLVVPFTWIYE